MYTTNNFSISDLENLTGVKAVTIRMWERRYNLLEPRRTSTNIRFYNNDDFKRLLNIKILQSKGKKISLIASMTPEEVDNAVTLLSKNGLDSNTAFQKILVSILELDEQLFNEVYIQLIKTVGFEACIEDTIFPMFSRIGMLWQSNAVCITNERFFTSIIQHRIISETQDLPLPKSDAPSALLFLPETEMHEIASLYINYLLRLHGYRTIYLGQTVPLLDVVEATKTLIPDAVFISVKLEANVSSLLSFVPQLTESFPNVKIYVGGYAFENRKISLPDAVIYVKTIKELKKKLFKKTV